MATNTNKKRSENFSPEETLFLVELVEEHLSLLKSKQTNQVTNAKKAAVWRHITDAVNSRGSGVVRSIDQVKEKYRKACSKAKVEKHLQKTHRVKTGGGPPPQPIDPVSQKILDIHHDSPNFIGIGGGVEVGGLVIQEVPAIPTCMLEKAESSGFQTINEETITFEGQGSTETILQLPENLEGTSVTYDVTLSSSGTLISSKNNETGKTKKRKIGQESLQDLQKSVLREDRERILLMKELIILQKEKVALEIKKLQMELPSKPTENEM
ncbi:uncharacterized protein LOC125649629 isoform X1 [Ostrea edulis]|uniref:uncharacterized protein LOC125649629 isoform X1 n=1 Tax=Ostrea edulis TaxID=37623 RepID=UPI0024AEF36E|nr:uncharacterized protein LOC125649629 isoform X1 [Ostrea edulis]